MKFLEYINEDSNLRGASFLETAACIGIIAPKFLIKKIDNLLLGSLPHTITSFCDEIIEDIGSILYKSYDWKSDGIRDIRKKIVDIKSLVQICRIIKGMSIFMSDVVKINTPIFIHNSIGEYYKIESKIFKTDTSKRNNADCIITNARTIDELLKSIQTDPPKGIDGYVITGEYKYFQVSLKAGSTNVGHAPYFPSKEVQKQTAAELVNNSTSESFKSFISPIKSIYMQITNTIKKYMTNLHSRLERFADRKIEDSDLKSLLSFYKGVDEVKSETDWPLIQQLMKVVSKNPSIAFNAINKELDVLERIAKSKNIDYVVRRITNPPNKIIYQASKEKTPEEKEIYIRLECLKLSGNLATIRFMQSILSDVETTTSNIKNIISDMVFGSTTLPLWKVNSYSGSNTPYMYIGDRDVYIKSYPTIENDVFGFMVIPTAKNEPHYQTKTFMLESVRDDGKYYYYLLTRPESSSSFVMGTEGVRLDGPYLPIDMDLMDIMVQAKR